MKLCLENGAVLEFLEMGGLPKMGGCLWNEGGGGGLKSSANYGFNHMALACRKSV